MYKTQDGRSLLSTLAIHRLSAGWSLVHLFGFYGTSYTSDLIGSERPCDSCDITSIGSCLLVHLCHHTLCSYLAHSEIIHNYHTIMTSFENLVYLDEWMTLHCHLEFGLSSFNLVIVKPYMKVRKAGNEHCIIPKAAFFLSHFDE